MPSTDRSPRYPGFSLAKAVQFARVVYNQEKRGIMPPDSVIRALGHDSMSGPAKVKIAALRQYGLLEDVGREKVRISERALTILMNPTPEEYRDAVQAAALAPSLFQKIKADYPDASDQTLRFYLIRDLSFSEDGAIRAIKAYRESQQFAELPDDSYNADSDASSSSGEPDQSEPRPVRVHSTQGGIQGTTIQAAAPEAAEKRKVAYTWPLPDDTDAQVSFSQRPTRRGIERLIAYLQFMHDDLPETTPLHATISPNEANSEGPAEPVGL